MTRPDAEAATAAGAVLTTTPPDDSGAETADRYEWQAAMAAADALAGYLEVLNSDGSTSRADFEIICELHEDWVVVVGDDAEIVSAKHKELSFGAFTTLHSLLAGGGVLHLYLRWKALCCLPRCRLVTSAGLSGPPSAFLSACEELRDGAGSPSAEVISRIAEFEAALNLALPAGNLASRDEVVAFMSSLRIDLGRPRRDHVREYAPSAYAAPVAARLGRPEAADAIWNAVLSTVRERMRAAGPRAHGSLPNVFGARDEAGFETRRVAASEIATVISVAIRHAHAYHPLPRAPRTSRVALKMAEGGCTDNAIERAEALRLQNRRYWRNRGGAPGVEPERESVLNRLRQIADEESEEVAQGGGRWGASLWRRLGHRTSEFAEDERALGLDGDLLLGGICDLSNRCEVWFSDRFDVEARRATMIDGGPR